MSDSSLVVLDGRQTLLHGVELPETPPACIYVSGHKYKLAAPYIVRPPLVNTVKIILNWLLAGVRKAKNIGYLQAGSTVDTTDSVWLKAVANAVMTAIAGSGLPAQQGSQATLTSVTAKDNSGLSESQADSDHAAVVGTNGSVNMSPQVAICWSWSIAASYRGGKPRWYIPGIPNNALIAPGDSQIGGTYATAFKNAGNAFAAALNAASPGGHDVVLGTISYQTAHAPRPTPLFRPFGTCHVHERVDSQRRRNGKEDLFPVIP